MNVVQLNIFLNYLKNFLVIKIVIMKQVQWNQEKGEKWERRLAQKQAAKQQHYHKWNWRDRSRVTQNVTPYSAIIGMLELASSIRKQKK